MLTVAHSLTRARHRRVAFPYFGHPGTARLVHRLKGARGALVAPSAEGYPGVSLGLSRAVAAPASAGNTFESIRPSPARNRPEPTAPISCGDAMPHISRVPRFSAPIPPGVAGGG